MAACCSIPEPAIVVARAPGRLDVMGGIADYSGSLVLQWPIREATLVAVQAVAEPGIKLVSLAAGAGHETRSFVLDASTTRQLLDGDYDSARRWFAARRHIALGSLRCGRAGRSAPENWACSSTAA